MVNKPNLNQNIQTLALIHLLSTKMQLLIRLLAIIQIISVCVARPILKRNSDKIISKLSSAELVVQKEGSDQKGSGVCDNINIQMAGMYVAVNENIFDQEMCGKCALFKYNGHVAYATIVDKLIDFDAAFELSPAVMNALVGSSSSSNSGSKMIRGAVEIYGSSTYTTSSDASTDSHSSDSHSKANSTSTSSLTGAALPSSTKTSQSSLSSSSPSNSDDLDGEALNDDNRVVAPQIVAGDYKGSSSASKPSGSTTLGIIPTSKPSSTPAGSDGEEQYDCDENDNAESSSAANSSKSSATASSVTSIFSPSSSTSTSKPSSAPTGSSDEDDDDCEGEMGDSKSLSVTSSSSATTSAPSSTSTTSSGENGSSEHGNSTVLYQEYNVQMTYYGLSSGDDQPPTKEHRGYCNKYYPSVANRFIALNAKAMGDNKYCGKCASVTRNGRSAIGPIIDELPSRDNGLDLSFEIFSIVAGGADEAKNMGMMQADFKIIDCPKEWEAIYDE